MPETVVLVAEDESTARCALKDLLESEGFTVLAAGDGQDALSQILLREPSVVLLDIRMPELDGLAVLQRAREAGAASAFIVMTAFGDSDTAIEAMKRGAFDYVSKPVDFEKLLPAIRPSRSARSLTVTCLRSSSSDMTRC